MKSIDEIEALEQEPCDVPDINVGDMISRQAVLDEISDYNNDLDYTTNELYDRIKRMSPVNPQLKTEQEPCYDAISRQDAIKKVSKILKGVFVEYEDIAQKAMNLLPSVTPQPKTGWIPVSEKLPEDGELVLFSTKTDRVFEGRYFADNTDRQWYAFRDETFAWNNVVIAWMPLPVPYKPQERSGEE